MKSLQGGPKNMGIFPCKKIFCEGSWSRDSSNLSQLFFFFQRQELSFLFVMGIPVSKSSISKQLLIFLSVCPAHTRILFC
jgi:hypothetical protein